MVAILRAKTFGHRALYIFNGRKRQKNAAGVSPRPIESNTDYEYDFSSQSRTNKLCGRQGKAIRQHQWILN